MKKLIFLAVMGMAAMATPGFTQGFVDYTGGTYFQNFDSLPYSNNISLQANNPVTINGQKYTFNGAGNAIFDFSAPIDNSGTIATSTGGLGLSSTLAGWYGSGVAAVKFGAQAGAETQGGIYSFGALTGANRALGLQSANGSGITTFGLKLVNDTGGDLTSINLSFVSELWRQATAKAIDFGFTVTNSSATMPLGIPNFGSISFAGGTAAALDGTLAANQMNVNLSNISVGNWHNGDALWITWQTASAAGSSQGIAIDNLSFAAIPEPSTIGLVGLGMISMLAIRRRNRSRR